MAGKNRANTLSAILSNMEDLTGAYESALNAEGSALRENETYLNSIEGRISLFNNAVQTMWMNFMDTDILKFIIDIGTAIVELADQIGLLPAVASGWFGFSAFKDNITENLKEAKDAIKKELDISQEQIPTPIVNADETSIAIDNTDAINDNTDAKQKSMQTNVDLRDSAKQSADGLKQQADATKNVGIVTKATSTITNNFKAVLKTLGQTLKTTLIAFAVTKGIELIMTGLYNATHKTERAIEAANDALAEYSNKQEELKKQEKTIDELGESYKRLSSGVNTLTNENIGLTVEAHQEYLDVCNDLAEIFPDLVMGYDAQGNAIINLTEDMKGLTQAAKDAQEEAARALLTDKNKKNIWTKVESGLNMSGSSELVTIADQKAVVEAIQSLDQDSMKQYLFHVLKGEDDQWDILKSAMKERGTYVSDAFMYDARDDVLPRSEVKEEFKNVWEDWKTFEDITQDDIKNFKYLLTSNLSELNQDISSAMISLRQTMSASFVFDKNYQDLDDTGKSLVESIYKQITPDMVAKSGSDTYDEFYKWFSDNVLTQVSENSNLYNDIVESSNDLARAMASGNETAYKAAASEWADLISDEWRDASGNIVIDTDADFVTQYLQRLAQEMENKSKNYEVRLQMRYDFGTNDSLGELLVAYTGADRASIESAIHGLNIANSQTLSGVKVDDIYKEIADGLDGEDGVLRTDEFENLYNKFVNNDMSDWSQEQVNAMKAVDAMLKIYGIDLATLTDMMMEFGYVQQSLSDIPSFNLASESTNKAIDEFQKNIETVKEAWNSLNNREMTKSEFLDLAQEFPDLMKDVDLSKDNWMVQAQENLEKLNETNIKDYLENLELMKEAMAARGEDTTILENYINYVKQIQNQPLLIPETKPDTISGITEAYEKYKTILEESNEILYDGQQVSESYYESLKEYVDDVDALNECFDENNKQIVTNHKQLKKLIAEQKKATAQTVREAKAQARLQYYDLYKEMKKLVDGSDSLSSATVDYINSLYDEMGAIQSAIAQYSMLESQLLGTTSAYEQLEQAQTLDAETDYGSKAEEMVNVLANAFNTSELGTASAQAAIAGLIPDDIIDKSKTLDEQMESIYKYFTSGEVSKLFTIEFDDDGGISSVEMTKENVEAFTKSLIGSAEEGAVFQGTWDEFTLNPAITSLKQFADELKVTEEVAFAYLTELEKYDINWLGGDYETLLDQLMGDDVSYGIQKTTQELAKLTKEKAALLEGGIDDGEKQRLAEINAEIETLNGKLDDHKVKALDAWQAYSEIDTALANTDNLHKKVSDVFSEDIIANVGLTGEETVKEAYDRLLAYQLKLGEPTELILQFASEQAEKELAALEDKLNKSGIEIEGKVELNAETGEWAYTGDTTGWTEEDKTTLQNYLNTYADLYNINSTLATGVDKVETYAQRTADAVESIDGKITEGSGGGTETGQEDGGGTGGGGKESPGAKNNTNPVVDGLFRQRIFTEGNSNEKPAVDEDAARLNLAIAKGQYTNWWSSASEAGAGGAGFYGQPYEDPAYASGGSRVVPGKEFDKDLDDADRNNHRLADKSASIEIEAEEVNLGGKNEQPTNTTTGTNDTKNGVPKAVQPGELAMGIASGQIVVQTNDSGEPDHPKENVAPDFIGPLQSWQQYAAENKDFKIPLMFNKLGGVNVFGMKKVLADNGWTPEQIEQYFNDLSTKVDFKSGKSKVNDQINPENNLSVHEEKNEDGSESGLNSLNEELSEVNTQTTEAGSVAYDMWQAYAQNDAALTALEEIKANRDEVFMMGQSMGQLLTHDEASMLGIELNVGDILTVQQAYDMLIAKRNELEQPAQITAEVALTEIDNQIAELESAITNNDFSNVDPVSVGLEVGEAPTKEDVEAKLAELKQDKAVISTVFGIELSEEDRLELEAELANIEQIPIGDKEFWVLSNGADSTLKILGEVQDYTIEDKSYTVTEYFQAVGVNSRPVGGGGRFTRFAANGTAHADGTAYKGGSWGAPKSEVALTGELGPEIRVRGNRWDLLGQNGAEFADIRKGDIIFNHKQTESLLSNGYVTGRGKAYAGGTAYAGINTFDYHFEGLSGDYSNTKSGDSGEKLSEAADSLSDAADEFKEIFDWIEVRLEEINEKLSLYSAKLENAIGSSKQNTVIDKMIDLNQKLYDNLTAGADEYYSFAKELLEKVPEEYRKAAQDGTIAIEAFIGEADEKTLEAIQNYREWVQKGADATQQAEETLTEISNLAKQAIDNISQDYENKASIPGIKLEQLEAYNALLETDRGWESEKIYKEMIKANNSQIDILEQQRNKMLSELNEQVEAGNIKKYSQAWYDAVNDIAAVDTEIINLTADTDGYQDAINELHFEKFENLMSRLDAVADEANNLIDVLSNEDLVDKDTAEWTGEGITSLGLYAQQMEVAEMQAKKYKEEIQYLNKNWKKLGYTEREYVEKLEELKTGQYDAIKAYNDTKDAIVDLTKERVDAIKEGIEKEIEAYEELISKKKEELDAEKDLHDFQKGVADQQKEIDDIERKLAALSADNSASARAQRAQLQAELLKAQADLEETYYDRSISDQQEALDKELENFREEKDKEIEGWDEYLEDTNKVVADGLATVQANTETVYNTLSALGQEYSLSIAEALTSPWTQGENAIQSFSEKFGLSMSATVNELKELEKEYKQVMSEIEQAGEAAVNKVKESTSNYTNAEYQEPKKEEPVKKEESKTETVAAKPTTYTVQSGDSLWSIAEKILGNGARWREIYNLNKDKIKDENKISKGWVLKLPAYAKGTVGVKSDELAWIDELGEELVIRPQNGRMAFLEKGSVVIPADLTANLMEWGELDPSVMLERNKPSIGISPEVHNTEVNITMDIAEVVHVDKVDSNTLPDLTKAVEKQLDKYMKNLNNQIRRYVK